MNDSEYLKIEELPKCACNERKFVQYICIEAECKNYKT